MRCLVPAYLCLFLYMCCMYTLKHLVVARPFVWYVAATQIPLDMLLVNLTILLTVILILQLRVYKTVILALTMLFVFAITMSVAYSTGGVIHTIHAILG